MTKRAIPWNRGLAILGGVVCALGAFLPWADFGIYIPRGIFTRGVIVVPIAILVVGLASLRWDKLAAGVATVLGLVAAGISLWYYHLISTALPWQAWGGGVPGTGLYLTLIGSVVIVIGALGRLLVFDRPLLYGGIVVALLVGIVWSIALGGLVADERHVCENCVPQVDIRVTVDAGTDTITLHHMEGAPLHSYTTSVEIRVSNTTIRLPRTGADENTVLRSGESVTIRFDGTAPSSPWTAYGAVPTIDIRGGEHIEVAIIHAPSQKVIFETSTD